MAMTWTGLAEAQLRAAASLARQELGERPSCSRAYYAAYSLLTHRLEPAKIVYAHGWRNPAHADVTKYVAHLVGLGVASKRSVSRVLRPLRHRREDADYRQGISVDRRAVRESLRDAAEIFRILGRPNES